MPCLLVLQQDIWKGFFFEFKNVVPHQYLLPSNRRWIPPPPNRRLPSNRRRLSSNRCRFCPQPLLVSLQPLPVALQPLSNCVLDNLIFFLLENVLYSLLLLGGCWGGSREKKRSIPRG